MNEIHTAAQDQFVALILHSIQFYPPKNKKWPVFVWNILCIFLAWKVLGKWLAHFFYTLDLQVLPIFVYCCHLLTSLLVCRKVWKRWQHCLIGIVATNLMYIGWMCFKCCQIWWYGIVHSFGFWPHCVVFMLDIISDMS